MGGKYKQMIKVSIIIRFHNEEKYLGECLDSIARQKGNYKKQLLLVNDNSTDKSLEVIDGFSKENPDIELKIINLTEKFTFSSAINAALMDADGQFTSIFSAHATMATDEWLIRILSNFTDPQVAICYGRLLVRADANTLSLMTSLTVSTPYKIIKSKQYFSRNDDSVNAFSYLNLNTCNVIRTELLKKYKFRDLPSVEDMDLGKRLLDDGYKIIYEPEAIVWHSHNDPTSKMVDRWINAAVGMGLIFKKKIPDKLRLLKSTAPSYFIFMLKVCNRERNILQKFNYFFRAISGVFKIFYKVIFDYKSIKKWEGMYLESSIN